MIGWLRGTLRERETGGVVIDVGGVGYVVRCPMSTFLELPKVGSVTELLVTTHVREDAITLYGFATASERDLFDRLNSVSGVGPRIALGALSALGAASLARAISSGDARSLASVPGIGKKTAERIVIDLRDKVDPLLFAAKTKADGGAAADTSDVVSALLNLGYPERLAGQAVADAHHGGAVGFEGILREALARLSKG